MSEYTKTRDRKQECAMPWIIHAVPTHQKGEAKTKVEVKAQARKVEFVVNGKRRELVPEGTSAHGLQPTPEKLKEEGDLGLNQKTNRKRVEEKAAEEAETKVPRPAHPESSGDPPPVAKRTEKYASNG